MQRSQQQRVERFRVGRLFLRACNLEYPIWVWRKKQSTRISKFFKKSALINFFKGIVNSVGTFWIKGVQLSQSQLCDEGKSTKSIGSGLVMQDWQEQSWHQEIDFSVKPLGYINERLPIRMKMHWAITLFFRIKYGFSKTVFNPAWWSSLSESTETDINI